MSNFMIYGATGYTGSLIAREAVRRGLRPILAGRSTKNVIALAGEIGLDYRIFALDPPEAIGEGIRGVHTLLNCAGPFSKTAPFLSEACIRGGINYLDITGEAGILEALAARDGDARASGITLLPAVGFDVVPSDCLALHLKHRLPTATRLVLAFQSGGRLSRGTALTALERADNGGLVRENGILRVVPTAWKTRVFDFGNGAVRAISIPWGDVATAFRSTGIPNIEVYLAAPWALRTGARMSRWFGWLLSSRWVQSRLRKRIMARPPGPSEAERRHNRCVFWAEVTDDAGRTAVAREQTPDGYDLTVQTALAAVVRVLAGGVSPGFRTPAMAFGPDFILEFDGVTRIDEPTTSSDRSM